MFNKKETFIFKPADVPDTVNPAKVTPAELMESRKDYTKTSIATVFQIWGKADVPEGSFNFRHLHCGVTRTGHGPPGALMQKHAIRFNRSMDRGKVRGRQLSGGQH